MEWINGIRCTDPAAIRASGMDVAEFIRCGVVTGLRQLLEVSICLVLCCAVLCWAGLGCAALRCAVLCCAVVCCAVRCHAVLCCAVLLRVTCWLLIPSLVHAFKLVKLIALACSVLVFVLADVLS